MKSARALALFSQASDLAALGPDAGLYRSIEGALDELVGFKLLRYGNRQEEVEKANDDFFAGNISQDEYNAKINAGGEGSVSAVSYYLSGYSVGDTALTGIQVR